ncbi:SMYD5 protein [Capsaspora owczarzaki ATCC 30864]|nr:SMYD5 protein [Capsaspora owczarzaki ATCC 30864]|eukprot:XP_004343338.2 SMYD5 protein [Capsaspora owczarzaki ATCC 30864]
MSSTAKANGKGKSKSVADSMPAAELVSARPLPLADEYFATLCAGKHVQVRVEDARKGRGLFATQAFKKGDIVFTEAPLVCAQFLWNEAYGYKACHQCMRSLESPGEMAARLATAPTTVVAAGSAVAKPRTPFELPFMDQCNLTIATQQDIVTCETCSLVFCNAACRDAAMESHHRILCTRNDADHPLQLLQSAWKSIHYPPETTSIMLLARIIAMLRQGLDKNSKDAFTAFQQFYRCYADAEGHFIHKFLDKKYDKQLAFIQELFKTALYDDRIPELFTTHGFRSLLALVGMNGQGVGTTALDMYLVAVERLNLSESDAKTRDQFVEKLLDDIDEHSGEFDACEGSALYCLQSCCNHNCQPNAVPTFTENNATLHMRAERDISAGDEICISYLTPEQRHMRRSRRMATLRENYLFMCACAKCEVQKAELDISSESSDDSESESAECC